MIKCDNCDNKALYNFQDVWKRYEILDDARYSLIDENLTDYGTNAHLCYSCSNDEGWAHRLEDEDTLYVEPNVICKTLEGKMIHSI